MVMTAKALNAATTPNPSRHLSNEAMARSREALSTNIPSDEDIDRLQADDAERLLYALRASAALGLLMSISLIVYVHLSLRHEGRSPS